MSLKRILCVTTFAGATLAAAGCGGSGTVTMNVKSMSTATMLNAKTQKIETYDEVLRRERAQLENFAAGDYGEAAVAAGGLTSFQMYFREIKICNSLTVSGSGYSGQSGCSTVYSNLSDAYEITNTAQAATSFNRAAAASASTGKYFDVLSAADRTSLTTAATVSAGEYNYGVIEAHHWVKVNAKVNSTTAVCTTSATVTDTDSTGGDGVVTTNSISSDVTSCGSPAEAMVWLGTANTSFKFLRPFTVAGGDTVELDLAFNLAQQVKGGAAGGNYNYKTSGGVGLQVPMLRMVPVPRKSTETTKVEQYLLTPASSADWQLRVELYYNSADADKTVLAAMITPVQTTSGTSNVDLSTFSLYAYSVAQSGTTVTFKSWDDSTSLILDRAGTSGTISCPTHSSGGYMLTSCGAATVTATYPAPTVYTLN